MKKLILLFIIALFVTSCGYQKIYSNQNLELSIKEISKDNTVINNEISNALLSIFSNSNSEKYFSLEIESKKTIVIKSKDSNGNPVIYGFKIETKVIAINNKNEKYENTFLKEIDYNNDDDKFKLSQYVNELEKILIAETIEEIISFLVDLK